MRDRNVQQVARSAQPMPMTHNPYQPQQAYPQPYQPQQSHPLPAAPHPYQPQQSAYNPGKPYYQDGQNSRDFQSQTWGALQQPEHYPRQNSELHKFPSQVSESAGYVSIARGSQLSFWFMCTQKSSSPACFYPSPLKTTRSL